MKGISLPINVIVIVAVAVLVLIVVAAFFTTSTISGEIGIRRQQALDNACQNLRSLYNCASGHLSDIEISYAEIGEAAPTKHSLGFICGKLNLDTSGSPSQCYLRCGCSTAGGGATPAATPTPAAPPAPPAPPPLGTPIAPVVITK